MNFKIEESEVRAVYLNLIRRVHRTYLEGKMSSDERAKWIDHYTGKLARALEPEGKTLIPTTTDRGYYVRGIRHVKGMVRRGALTEDACKTMIERFAREYGSTLKA